MRQLVYSKIKFIKYETNYIFFNARVLAPVFLISLRSLCLCGKIVDLAVQARMPVPQGKIIYLNKLLIFLAFEVGWLDNLLTSRTRALIMSLTHQGAKLAH